MKHTGKVKWFNEQKGYGFITPDGAEPEVFVHYSSLRGHGRKLLAEGETVSFEVVHGIPGRRAANVVRLAA